MAAHHARNDFYFTSEDGLQLYAAVYGPERRGVLPVVCLPGLTRNSRDFHELALHLSERGEAPRQVVAFDYRGRGNSDRDRRWRNYDVPVEARDVLTGLAACGIEEAAFVGTSRGGLIAMAIAVLRPTVLRAVVLNDIGPVISGEGIAQIRSYLERAPKPRTFQEALTVQKAAIGQSFAALMEDDWEKMVRAFYREEKRGFVPDYDHNILKTVGSVDVNKSLPTLWPQFMAMASVPLLVIRGGNSRLLSAETVEEMASRHPDMQQVVVEGQGHAPLLWTGELPALIAGFIDRAEKKRPRRA
jgi:pimeloyl-ACP methyl ester carboxylesterase